MIFFLPFLQFAGIISKRFIEIFFHTVAVFVVASVCSCFLKQLFYYICRMPVYLLQLMNRIS